MVLFGNVFLNESRSGCLFLLEIHEKSRVSKNNKLLCVYRFLDGNVFLIIVNATRKNNGG